MESSVALLDVRTAAEQRRSIRSYEPGPIPAEDLTAILDVVRRAPSAFNLQPWRFVIVESAEVKAALAEATGGQRQVHSAPAVIVLYTDVADALEHIDEVLHPNLEPERRAGSRERILRSFGRRSEEDRERWGAEQGNIALGYLLLSAAAHGYQTVPMLGFDAAAVRELLGLPSHVRIPALVAIGRGAEPGHPHHRHELERIVRAA